MHRSQRDPLAADETAPQRVLVPVNAAVPHKKEKDPVSNMHCKHIESWNYDSVTTEPYNNLILLKKSCNLQ